MSDLMQTTFDYGALPQETAVELRMAADRIRLRMKRTAEDIIEIGSELVTAKEQLLHGQFGAWLQAEFEMAEMTAQRFMQVATRFGGKSNNLLDLKPSILYLLASPSTPETVVEQVTSGETPATTAAVKVAIAAAKAEAEAIAAAALAEAKRANAAANAAQQRLFETQEETGRAQEEAQQRIASLQAAMEELETEIASMQKPEEVRVEVPDPKQAERITALEAQAEAMRREKDELEKRNRELGAHAEQLQKEAQQAALDRVRGEETHRLQMQWRANANKIVRLIREAQGMLPTPNEIAAFEETEWGHLDEVKQALLHMASATEQVHGRAMNVIDVEAA